MKIASITSIHKKHHIPNMTNYRFINILPQFSKILEKLLEKKI